MPRFAQPSILFEDENLLILSKPAGLLSQGEIHGLPNLVDWARERWGQPYVGLIHRLDRGTSGLMMLARRSSMAAKLTAALQGGRVERRYLAWVVGTLSEPVHWQHRLWKDRQKNLVRVVRPEQARYAEAQDAILRAIPVSRGVWRGEPLSLLEFKLETGRSHQIRVQAAFERLPLLGDEKYGKVLGFSRIALHSHSLEFVHPRLKCSLRFESPLPEDLALL